MKAKRTTIESALPIVAAAYGRRFGVKVVIGRDMAYTDGKTIVVPNIPEDWPHKDALWGYLAHEAAHVRFTDFTVNMGKGTLKHLWNIVEDARIEREMIAVYPGTARSLNEVARYMGAAGHYQIPDDNSPAASILETFCLYHLQCRCVGQDAIEPFLEATRSVFERKFPKGVQVRLHALLRRVPSLTNTAEAMALAREILKMIQEEAEKESQPQQQDGQPGPSADSQSSPSGDSGDDADDATNSPQGGDGGGDPSPGDDDGSSSSDGAGQGADGADGSPTGATGTAGSDDDSADPQANASGKSQGDGDADQGDNDTADDGSGNTRESGSSGSGSSGSEAARVLQEVLDADDDDHLRDAHTALRQELNSAAGQSGNPDYRSVREAIDIFPDAGGGKALSDEVRRTSSRIRTQLMGLVQASQRLSSRTSRRGKRVDTSRLHRLQSGDTRVFLKEHAKRFPNTAVHLLVDASGSMGRPAQSGEKMYQVASKAAMAIAMALEAIKGVNPAVTYFCGSEYQPVFSAVRHGERVSPNKGKFTFAPTGTTPMAEAIWYSAFELVQTREERKMLVIVTDGDPDDARATQSVIDLCERSGVEVIGIGVGSAAISYYVDNHVVIGAVEDLQKTLFRLMERSLTAVAA